MHGQAFEFGGATYATDNCTLTGMNHDKHDKQIKMDVANGPFITYGISCDRSNSFANGLFDIVNKGTGAEQHRYSAADVAVYNITSFMWEIATGKEYQMSLKGDVHSGLGAEVASENASPPKLREEGLDRHQDPGMSPHPQLKFSFVPVTDFRKISRTKYKKHFDSVFVSNKATNILEVHDFYELLKNDALLTVETSRFDLSKSESGKKESIEKVKTVMSGVNAVETKGECNMEECCDALITYKFKSTDE